MNFIKRIFNKKTDKQCAIHIVKRTYAVSYYTKGCDGKNVKHTIHTLARSSEEADEKVKELRNETKNNYA